MQCVSALSGASKSSLFHQGDIAPHWRGPAARTTIPAIIPAIMAPTTNAGHAER